MPIIPRRTTGVSIPMGRPSNNLGSIFHGQINGIHNLPINIFPSNPLTLHSPLAAAHAAASKVGQTTPASSGLVSMLIGGINMGNKLTPLKGKGRRRPRFSSQIGTAIWVGPDGIVHEG